ncbi:MAG: hypothetical protein ACJ8F7_19105 [Gemmataceae bacterium]
MWLPPDDHPLRRLFSGLTEQTFVADLGVADPPLIDYLSRLLSRFLHMKDIYRLGDARGRPLVEVVDMVLEAEGLPPDGRTRREVHRHVGDFTLFWTGLFPEALEKRRSLLRKDAFIDYCSQGKRSYYIASTFEDEPFRDESRILRRLSDEFELCAYGLNRVRQELDHRS